MFVTCPCFFTFLLFTGSASIQVLLTYRETSTIIGRTGHLTLALPPTSDVIERVEAHHEVEK